jgi:quercetin dioxygenase-like cupin family protein
MEKFSMEQYRIDFESMEWETPAEGVRFKAYEEGGRKLRLVEFGKEFIEPDWCAKGHIGYILQGQMEIDFDGKVILFGPGDGVFIPPGQEHKHKGRVLTDKVTAILAEEVF